jgi:hypothetical protein
MHLARWIARAGHAGRVAHLIRVDGMIMAASAMLLAEWRAGRRGAALLAGSVASLAANVVLAELPPDRACDRGQDVIRPYCIV